MKAEDPSGRTTYTTNKNFKLCTYLHTFGITKYCSMHVLNTTMISNDHDIQWLPALAQLPVAFYLHVQQHIIILPIS